MSVYSDDTVFIGPNGEKLRYAVLKAQASSAMSAKKRNILKRLSPQNKKDFYYATYQILDKQTLEDKSNPFLQIGLSPYTFMNEPLRIGGFDTSYGELFNRMHMALNQAEQTFDFGDEK